jgi:Cu2+-exporting ATPase
MTQVLATNIASAERDSVATSPGNDNTPLVETVTLIADTMHCGLCMVTTEDALKKLPGVREARANLSLRRIRVVLDRSRNRVEDLLAALEAAGYPAAELIDGRDAESQARDLDFLKRLGVAGFAAANIMLLSVSVWSGSGNDMGLAIQGMFHWISALIALPAVAYAGQPFFRSAVGALRHRHLNMDVPISLGSSCSSAAFSTSACARAPPAPPPTSSASRRRPPPWSSRTAATSASPRAA